MKKMLESFLKFVAYRYLFSKWMVEVFGQNVWIKLYSAMATPAPNTQLQLKNRRWLI
jgi:hypothetical protein